MMPKYSKLPFCVVAKVLLGGPRQKVKMNMAQVLFFYYFKYEQQ